MHLNNTWRSVKETSMLVGVFTNVGGTEKENKTIEWDKLQTESAKQLKQLLIGRSMVLLEHQSPLDGHKFISLSVVHIFSWRNVLSPTFHRSMLKACCSVTANSCNWPLITFFFVSYLYIFMAAFSLGGRKFKMTKRQWIDERRWPAETQQIKVTYNLPNTALEAANGKTIYFSPLFFN